MCFGIRCVGCTSHSQASCQHGRQVWAAGSPGETAALLCWEAGEALGRPSGVGVSLESPLGLALRGGVTYPTRGEDGASDGTEKLMSQSIRMWSNVRSDQDKVKMRMLNFCTSW